MVARKTTRLLAELPSARWQPSPRTDADEQCEFWYQPEGWGKAYRFIALRYQKRIRFPSVSRTSCSTARSISIGSS